ncbi:hypothetical protein ARMGADRAFT_1062006 [Armillaria gallica]|uniref:Uncharacterized protein n=1 Tax=Armillaria gallica TaxID=47427 RepID=A0A2H3DJF7_ARMGA|nr:hypothetical protein ARMGADRAFT_1062006 [Armillaria gallica]
MQVMIQQCQAFKRTRAASPMLCVIITAFRMVRRLLSRKSLASNIIVSTEWSPLPPLHPAQPLGERLWSHQEDLPRLDLPKGSMKVMFLALIDHYANIATTRKVPANEVDDETRLSAEITVSTVVPFRDTPLPGLFTVLSSILKRYTRRPSGADQSKVPLSKRKPAFNIRRLFEGETEKVFVEDLAGEELWTVENIKVLVSITSRIVLCDQIFTAPIHWTKAVDFPETATQATDFGLSGISGIGSLTARDLDGCGVRVVVGGDSAKGDTEL